MLIFPMSSTLFIVLIVGGTVMAGKGDDRPPPPPPPPLPPSAPQPDPPCNHNHNLMTAMLTKDASTEFVRYLQPDLVNQPLFSPPSPYITHATFSVWYRDSCPDARLFSGVAVSCSLALRKEWKRAITDAILSAYDEIGRWLSVKTMRTNDYFSIPPSAFTPLVRNFVSDITADDLSQTEVVVVTYSAKLPSETYPEWQNSLVLCYPIAWDAPLGRPVAFRLHFFDGHWDMSSEQLRREVLHNLLHCMMPAMDGSATRISTSQQLRRDVAYFTAGNAANDGKALLNCSDESFAGFPLDEEYRLQYYQRNLDVPWPSSAASELRTDGSSFNKNAAGRFSHLESRLLGAGTSVLGALISGPLTMSRVDARVLMATGKYFDNGLSRMMPWDTTLAVDRRGCQFATGRCNTLAAVTSAFCIPQMANGTTACSPDYLSARRCGMTSGIPFSLQPPYRYFGDNQGTTGGTNVAEDFCPAPIVTEVCSTSASDPPVANIANSVWGRSASRCIEGLVGSASATLPPLPSTYCVEFRCPYGSSVEFSLGTEWLRCPSAGGPTDISRIGAINFKGTVICPLASSVCTPALADMPTPGPWVDVPGTTVRVSLVRGRPATFDDANRACMSFGGTSRAALAFIPTPGALNIIAELIRKSVGTDALPVEYWIGYRVTTAVQGWVDTFGNPFVSAGTQAGYYSIQVTAFGQQIFYKTPETLLPSFVCATPAVQSAPSNCPFGTPCAVDVSGKVQNSGFLYVPVGRLPVPFVESRCGANTSRTDMTLPAGSSLAPLDLPAFIDAALVRLNMSSVSSGFWIGLTVPSSIPQEWKTYIAAPDISSAAIPLGTCLVLGKSSNPTTPLKVLYPVACGSPFLTLCYVSNAMASATSIVKGLPFSMTLRARPATYVAAVTDCANANQTLATMIDSSFLASVKDSLSDFTKLYWSWQASLGVLPASRFWIGGRFSSTSGMDYPRQAPLGLTYFPNNLQGVEGSAAAFLGDGVPTPSTQLQSTDSFTELMYLCMADVDLPAPSFTLTNNTWGASNLPDFIGVGSKQSGATLRVLQSCTNLAAPGVPLFSTTPGSIAQVAALVVSMYPSYASLAGFATGIVATGIGSFTYGIGGDVVGLSPGLLDVAAAANDCLATYGVAGTLFSFRPVSCSVELPPLCKQSRVTRWTSWKGKQNFRYEYSLVPIPVAFDPAAAACDVFDSILAFFPLEDAGVALNFSDILTDQGVGPTVEPWFGFSALVDGATPAFNRTYGAIGVTESAFDASATRYYLRGGTIPDSSAVSIARPVLCTRSSLFVTVGCGTVGRSGEPLSILASIPVANTADNFPARMTFVVLSNISNPNMDVFAPCGSPFNRPPTVAASAVSFSCVFTVQCGVIATPTYVSWSLAVRDNTMRVRSSEVKAGSNTLMLVYPCPTLSLVNKSQNGTFLVNVSEGESFALWANGSVYDPTFTMETDVIVEPSDGGITCTAMLLTFGAASALQPMRCTGNRPLNSSSLPPIYNISLNARNVPGGLSLKLANILVRYNVSLTGTAVPFVSQAGTKSNVTITAQLLVPASFRYIVSFTLSNTAIGFIVPATVTVLPGQRTTSTYLTGLVNGSTTVSASFCFDASDPSRATVDRSSVLSCGNFTIGSAITFTPIFPIRVDMRSEFLSSDPLADPSFLFSGVPFNMTVVIPAAAKSLMGSGVLQISLSPSASGIAVPFDDLNPSITISTVTCCDDAYTLRLKVQPNANTTLSSYNRTQPNPATPEVLLSATVPLTFSGNLTGLLPQENQLSVQSQTVKRIYMDRRTTIILFTGGFAEDVVFSMQQAPSGFAANATLRCSQPTPQYLTITSDSGADDNTVVFSPDQWIVPSTVDPTRRIFATLTIAAHEESTSKTTEALGTHVPCTVDVRGPADVFRDQYTLNLQVYRRIVIKVMSPPSSAPVVVVVGNNFLVSLSIGYTPTTISSSRSFVPWSADAAFKPSMFVVLQSRDPNLREEFFEFNVTVRPSAVRKVVCFQFNSSEPQFYVVDRKVCVQPVPIISPSVVASVAKPLAFSQAMGTANYQSFDVTLDSVPVVAPVTLKLQCVALTTKVNNSVARLIPDELTWANQTFDPLAAPTIFSVRIEGLSPQRCMVVATLVTPHAQMPSIPAGQPITNLLPEAFTFYSPLRLTLNYSSLSRNLYIGKENAQRIYASLPRTPALPVTVYYRPPQLASAVLTVTPAFLTFENVSTAPLSQYFVIYASAAMVPPTFNFDVTISTLTREFDQVQVQRDVSFTVTERIVVSLFDPELKSVASGRVQIHCGGQRSALHMQVMSGGLPVNAAIPARVSFGPPSGLTTASSNSSGGTSSPQVAAVSGVAFPMQMSPPTVIFSSALSGVYDRLLADVLLICPSIDSVREFDAMLKVEGPPEFASGTAYTLELRPLREFTGYEAFPREMVVGFITALTIRPSVMPPAGKVLELTMTSTCGGAIGVAEGGSNKVRWENAASEQTIPLIATAAVSACDIIFSQSEASTATNFVVIGFQRTVTVLDPPQVVWKEPNDPPDSTANVVAGRSFQFGALNAQYARQLTSTLSSKRAPGVCILVTSSLANAVLGDGARTLFYYLQHNITSTVSLNTDATGSILSVMVRLPTSDYLCVAKETISLKFNAACFENNSVAVPDAATATYNFTVRPDLDDISEVKQGIVGSTLVLSSLTSFAAGAAMASQGPKLSILSEAGDCPVRGWQERRQSDMSKLENPIPFNAGTVENLGVFFGAAVMNTAIVGAWIVLHGIVVLFVFVYRSDKNLSDKTIAKAMSICRFPCGDLFPMLYFGPIIMEHCLRVIVYSPSSTLRLVSGFMLATPIGGIVGMFWVLGQQQETTYICVEEERKYTFLQRLTRMRGKWRGKDDASWMGRYSMIFDEFIDTGKWYGIIEAVVTLCMGALNAFEPWDRNTCFAKYITLLLLFVVTLATVCYMRPFRRHYNNAFFIVATAGQCVSALVSVAAMSGTKNDFGVMAASVATVVIGNILLIKAVVDVFSHVVLRLFLMLHKKFFAKGEEASTATFAVDQREMKVSDVFPYMYPSQNAHLFPWRTAADDREEEMGDVPGMPKWEDEAEKPLAPHRRRNTIFGANRGVAWDDDDGDEAVHMISKLNQRQQSERREKELINSL